MTSQELRKTALAPKLKFHGIISGEGGNENIVFRDTEGKEIIFTAQPINFRSFFVLTDVTSGQMVMARRKKDGSFTTKVSLNERLSVIAINFHYENYPYAGDAPPPFIS